MSMENPSFNPHNPEYKKVKDLPKEHRKDFVNVEGGFVKKTAFEADAEAEKIAAIASVIQNAKLEGVDIRHTEALIENQQRDSIRENLLKGIKSIEKGWQMTIRDDSKLRYLNFENTREHILGGTHIKNEDEINLKDAISMFANDKELMQAGLVVGIPLGLASPELRADKEFVLVAVKAYGKNLEFASEELKNDPEVVKEAVKQNGEALRFANDSLKNDPDLTAVSYKTVKVEDMKTLESLQNKALQIEAVRIHPELLLTTKDKSLLDDKEIVLAAVRAYGAILKFASKTLRADKEIVTEACKSDWKRYYPEITGHGRHGSPLEFADASLKNDKEFMESMIKIYPSNLEFAGNELKNDYDFIVSIIKEGEAYLISYASEQLKDNDEFAKTVVDHDVASLSYLSDRISGNREFVEPYIMKDPRAMAGISSKLREDKKFILDMAAHNPKVIAYYQTGGNLLHDKEFVLEILKTTKCAPEVVARTFHYGGFSREEDLDFWLEIAKINTPLIKFAPQKLRVSLQKVGVSEDILSLR